MVLDDVTVVGEDVTFVLHALAALQTNVTKEMEHLFSNEGSSEKRPWRSQPQSLSL